MLPRFLSRESAIALALAGLVFWAPLPAGSVTPAAELLLRLAAVALLALALAVHSEPWPRPAILPVMGLAVVAALGLLQSLPWPTALAVIVSPEHARLYGQAVALIDETARPSFTALSLDAAVSRSSAISWFTAAAVLAIALVAGRSSRHRRWFLAALVATALLQVGVGLVRLQRAFPGSLVAMLLDPGGRLQGAYANPNSLSFLLEMSLVVVAAWCWCALRRAATARRRALALVPVCLWVVLLAAVVLTGSRAGLVAALFGTVAQIAALPLIDRGRRVVVAVALILLVGLGGLVAVGAHLEIQRYEATSLFEDNLRSRLLVITPSLDLWRSFPLTGTGLGTFEDAFPLVSPAELTPALWNRAHNDPLELLVTGGLVAFGLGVLVALSLQREIWRALRDGRRTEERAAGMAALGALVAAAVHELLDFGLVIPANSLVLLVILGSAAAAGISRASRQTPG